jgi:hypothetical protein
MKLSASQANIIEKMNNGFRIVRYRSWSVSYSLISDNCKGGTTISKSSVESLVKKGLIEVVEDTRFERIYKLTK